MVGQRERDIARAKRQREQQRLRNLIQLSEQGKPVTRTQADMLENPIDDKLKQMRKDH